ncbi:MAG: acetoacetate decarboxylase family protein [Actinomycetota bacterium]
MESKFLEDVEQHAVEITGGTCDVPILYHEVFAAVGVFTAPTLKLKELLPSSKLVPAEVYPGKGLLGFMAADYRDTTIGPYREFIIMVPVRYQPRFNPPLLPVLRMTASLSFQAFIWQLPLTSEVGLRAGIDIWGFPKFIADIDFSEDPDWVKCTLGEKGEHILTLEVKKNPARMKTYFDYTLFSVKERELLRTQVNGIAASLGRSFRPGGARLTLGEHAISRRIREVAPGRSMMTMYVPRSQLILPEAEERLAL